MTIQDYEHLTGITVAPSDENRINAIIRRCESRLSSLLGYSLSKQGDWTELGKVQLDSRVPFPSLPIDDDVIDKLIAPDDQTGYIQLFNLDELDKYIRINPAKEVYRVKVVLPVSDSEFITIHDFKNGIPYLNPSGLVVAITRNESWYNWAWWDSILAQDKSKLMLAVDADYFSKCDLCEYDDLAYLLADMVSYYSDDNYSLMGNIRSESIDSHSYSRASTGSTPDNAAPEGQALAKKTIGLYAGPSAFKKVVR